MNQLYKPQQETLLSEPTFKMMIRDIQHRTYWMPTQRIFEKFVKELIKKKSISERKSLVLALDYLTKILLGSKQAVFEMIRKSGKNFQQASKAVAGNNYQALVSYSLNRNIEAGNLPPDLIVTLKPRNHPLVQKYATIRVGEDIQKPDIDLLIYQERPKSPLVICSCKTSLRERAGQTYKWKLLVDFATTKCRHIRTIPACPINKYKLRYKKDRKLYIAIITADLYSELKQPQQAGMFSFFDLAYSSNYPRSRISKSVKPLSSIIEDLKEIYH